MGKLAENPHDIRLRGATREWLRLQRQHRELTTRLAKLDKQLEKFVPKIKAKKPANLALLNQWLDELSEGLDHLPPLPVDFSRADIYDDHD